MSALLAIEFEQPEIHAEIDARSAEDMDEVEFGIIGMDSGGLVRRYNRHEATLAGLSLRLLAAPGMNLCYVLVKRTS